MIKNDLLRHRQRNGGLFVRIFITLSSHSEFHWTSPKKTTDIGPRLLITTCLRNHPTAARDRLAMPPHRVSGPGTPGACNSGL
jgi:hypothetical protein